MVESFLTQLGFYVDLHAGGAYPTVDYVYIINDEPLSRASEPVCSTTQKSRSREPQSV